MDRTHTEPGAQSVEPEPYIYKPLNHITPEVRMLRLKSQPAMLPDGRKLMQGNLEITPLPKRPPYTAVSYCWGDPTNTTPILLDGRIKHINQNLAAYLSQCVQEMQKEGKESKVYWADAICIDQIDDKEKSCQVRLMSRIFRNATAMDAWLGPATPSSPAAFECLRDIHRICLGPRRTLHVTILVYFLSNKTERIRPLEQLVNLPWWRRVWVQQEVELASLDAITLKCGTDHIAWKFVVESFFNVRVMQVIPSKFLMSKLTPAQWDFVLKSSRTIISLMTAHCLYQSQQYGRWDIIEAEQSLAAKLKARVGLVFTAPEATLAVDYVFGVMGIITDAQKVLTYFQVDYEQPLEKIYIPVAHYLYDSYGALTLSLIHAGGVSLELPSWVPDWSGLFLESPIAWNPHPGTVSKSNGCYNVCGHFKQFSFRIVDKMLHLHGLRVDWVTDCGFDQPLDFSYGRQDRTEGWLRMYDSWVRRKLGEDYDQWVDTIWRIPICDRDIFDFGRRAAGSMLTAFNGAVEFAKRLHSGNQNFLPSFEIAKYRDLVEDAASAFRLPFFTATGRLGQGPFKMRVGDAVFILSGAETPFILRSQGPGQFRLIGEAYVHGIMDGAAVTPGMILETLEIV